MFLPDFLNLGVGFQKYFTTVPALSDELKRAAFEVRHDVYCRDMAYEPVRPDGLETDEYDDHSVHCLLKSKLNGDYAGCVRLILTRPGDADAPLPFETLCEHTIDRSIVDPAGLPRERIAEVSRLAVLGKYRRRKHEKDRPAAINPEDFGTREQPRFPYLTVGLYLGLLAQARQHGIKMLFVLTEQRLAVHLNRLGVTLQRIGGPVDHRGPRAPSLLMVDDVIAGFGTFVRPLYDVIAEEIDAEYRAFRAPRGETVS